MTHPRARLACLRKNGKTGSALRLLGLVGPTLFAVVAVGAPQSTEPPDVLEPRGEPRSDEAGAFSVNPRGGAAGFGYRFKLPPARGVGADLALTYSSSGPIRDEVAQGWSL